MTDPAEKEAASDQFHKIQSAYEILIDSARRERYDAQVHLAELKRETLARQSESRARSADVRSFYKSSQEPPMRAAYGRTSERVVPQTEERRPSYANDYFDAQPRATTRKEPEYAERTPRRAPPEHKDKEKLRGFFSRSSKDSEREKRKEKTKATEKDTRRERERKYTPHVVDEDSESDSDDYHRRSRRMRVEDDERKEREQRCPQPPRPQREPMYDRYSDWTRKMHSASEDARHYIASSRAEQGRPPPPRISSTRDARVEYRRGAPVMTRSRSDRPGKDMKESTRKTSSRTPERRSSTEHVEVRRPPPLNSSKSSPADIHVPNLGKARSASLQPESDAMPPPSVKRSETMPYKAANAPKSSRATESTDGQPTPAATPENREASPSKYNYGPKYGDENNEPISDYRNEMREPPLKDKDRQQFTRRVMRTPSPIEQSREPARESVRENNSREPLRDYPRDPRSNMSRAASSVYERPQPLRTSARTTSYVYPERGMVDRDVRSQQISREQSPRDAVHLYGEIRHSAGSPRDRYSSYTTPDETLRYSKPSRAEEMVKMASGYPARQRPNGARPGIGRSGSGNPVYA